MEQKFTKITDKAEWHGLLDKVLFKTFFHFWEWEEFLESQFKWLKFERYLWKNQAILSFARVKISGKEKLVSHLFWEYGGPLPLAGKIDGSRFQKDLFEEFKTPLKIAIHPKLLDYFEGMEFQENQRESYFFDDLDSKSSEDIWRLMDRNRHRSIKSAQESGFQIEACRDLEELKKLYDIYVENMKKHKAIPYPPSFFEFFFRSPSAEVMAVKRGGAVAGGNIFLFYDKTVHSFLCGFGKIDKIEGAHSLVLWEEIKKIKDRDYRVFDFGAARKDSSIRDFKERWGAKAYPIYELKNYSGDSSLRKSKLRDIFGLLPVFLIKKLSPYLLKYKL